MPLGELFGSAGGNGFLSDPYDRATFSGSLMGLAQGLLSQRPGEGVGAALGRGFGLAGSEAENARRAVTKKGDRKRDTEYRKKLAKELQDHGPEGDDTMSPDRVRFAQTYIASPLASGAPLGMELVRAMFARKTQGEGITGQGIVDVTNIGETGDERIKQINRVGELDVAAATQAQMDALARRAQGGTVDLLVDIGGQNVRQEHTTTNINTIFGSL